MSTQLIGFSIGGICKRFLVSPPSMIWPTNLVTAALFNTLHAQQTSGAKGRGGITRERFFCYVFVGYICYSQFFCSVLGPAALIVIILDFFPTYLFTALSSFSWICWMAPHNPTVNQLFGVNHGLAMGVLTFDWGQIAYNGSPLPIPWWAMANVAVTVVFFFWFLLPVLYVRTSYFSFFFALLIIGDCSTPTFGTVLIFPWCLRTLSITRGANTTSPGSSTAIPPSTSRLTRNTAPSFFPRHLPLPTGSRLHLSPPLLHTPSSTTANRSGLRLVAPSPNNLTSTPASCPCTGRFRIRGT